MKTIGAAKFKEQCLALLERLGPEGLIITKHGVPIAKVLPIKKEGAHLIGSLSKKIKIVEGDDLFTTNEKWNAQS